eukprot:gene7398-8219_t
MATEICGIVLLAIHKFLKMASCWQRIMPFSDITLAPAYKQLRDIEFHEVIAMKLKRFIVSNWTLFLAVLVLSFTALFILPLYEETIIKGHQMSKQCVQLQKHITTLRVKQYDPFCGPHTLGKYKPMAKEKSMNSDHNRSSTCQIASPEKLICEDIKDLYEAYYVDLFCSKEVAFELCKTANAGTFDRRNLKSLEFSCQLCLCDAEQPFSIGTTNSDTGLHYWLHVAVSQNVEPIVSREAIKALEAGNPYIFLRCTSKKTKQFINHLLVLPFVPFGPNRINFGPVENHNPSININMMLIDSISRPHFYRSLPRTVEYLTMLRQSNKHRVLDYELFHSVKGRTFESINALFTGKLIQMESKFEGQRIPLHSVGFEKLLRRFKDRHYETLYQEDLCWQYDWGLVRDLGILKKGLKLEMKYSEMNKAYKKNFIENVGVTHSTCEVFHSLGIIDHFNHPSKICYAGRLQHDFFLEYLLDALKATKENPLFSFSLLNVGHEGTGRRIRTFDESLRDFLVNIQDRDDTINILFSDHGNNYGFFSQSQEGQFEMFHPVLFMIIPQAVAKKIGDAKMRNLEINQHRLMTLVDVHYTLISLLDVFTNNTDDDRDHGNEHKQNNGLLGEISPKRGCDDLNLLRGTLCFCEGWKTKLSVTSVHYLIAEFAIATLNQAIIQTQTNNWRNVTNLKGKYCQHLQGLTIRNVWQRRKRLKMYFGMDIITQQSSIFSVVVAGQIDRPNSLDLHLDSVERLTRTYKSGIVFEGSNACRNRLPLASSGNGSTT